jgi:type I restriction enzyme S subunit
MSFPRYPSYKDSGVEWLGDVPAHWDVMPVKFVSSCNDEVIEESTIDDYEIEYVEISSVDSIYGITETTTMRFGTAPSRARRKVKDGDVIVSTVRTYLRAIAPIYNPPENMIVSTGFAVIRPRFVESHFLGYLFRAEFLIASVISRSVGVSYPAINASELMKLNVPVPPTSEQKTIAAFLDRETAKIDALIAEQQRLIELLKEKRQAVISHAVTKGLNPDAPMKDSGIEWLGEVPAHWEVKPIKFFIEKIESGTSVNAIDEPAQDNQIGVLKTSCVYSGVFNPTENKTVVEQEIDRVTCPVKSDTLIVSRMNTPDLVGATGLVTATAENIYLPDRLWQISFLDANPAFIYYWTQTTVYRAYIKSVCSGTSSSMQNLSQDQFRSFSLGIPGLKEQEKIVSFLISEIAKLDTLTAEAQHGIALLQERRSALISAAVTRKIDVRRYQPYSD